MIPGAVALRERRCRASGWFQRLHVDNTADRVDPVEIRARSIEHFHLTKAEDGGKRVVVSASEERANRITVDQCGRLELPNAPDVKLHFIRRCRGLGTDVVDGG